MSSNIMWGEASLAGSLQPLLTVDQAPILDINDVPITTVTPFVVFEPLLTVGGVDIVTVNNAPILAIAAGAEAPAYWQTADVTADGGVPFSFQYKTNPWQPKNQSGECVFKWCTIAVAWSMAAQIRMTPFVDGSADDVTLPNGDILQVVPVLFNLAQQGAALERLTEVFTVPFVRRQLRDGVEIARWYLRGERLQFLIESTGQLGSGELMLEGQDIEYEGVRKSKFATIDASGATA